MIFPRDSRPLRVEGAMHVHVRQHTNHPRPRRRRRRRCRGRGRGRRRRERDTRGSRASLCKTNMAGVSKIQL